MSVSYYNPHSMYRHNQPVAPSTGHFQTNSSMHHPWYSHPGYHQGVQMPTAPSSYCMEDQQQQIWHHGPHHPHVFQHDFQDFMHQPGSMPPHSHQTHLDPENQLPSPPITVSGSDMSSPGAGSGNITPPNNSQGIRPPPARSPYEWIKKTSYQTQPNPGKTRTKDKYRVVYTDHQRIELEKEFTFNNKYITIRRKSELAVNLGLSERQIKIWFQNRRAKERKQNKKRVEEKPQIDMNRVHNYQQSMVNHHQGLSNYESNQTVLPIVPTPPDIMQRYLDHNSMKLETEQNDQLG